MAKRSRQASKRTQKIRSSKRPLGSESVPTPKVKPEEQTPCETRQDAQDAQTPSFRERPTLAEPWVADARLDDRVLAPTHDELDEEFFRRADELELEYSRDLDSYPPVVEPIVPPPEPSPDVLARRKKYRKLVAVVVTLGTLFSLGGVGKSMFDRPVAAAESPGGEQAKVVEKAAVDSQPIEIKTVSSEVPSSIPTPSAQSEASDKPTEAVAAPDKEAGDYGDNPRATALSLLNRGKMKEAIPAARAAIEKEPEHALAYLYLGTALQDTGQHKTAMEVYSACVRTAKKGPVWECRAMGGKP
ncbi:MAG TPA: tetratricopeptide repeat protein [Polyangiaceae bacterium]|nr:MAG: hypothetical protein BWY17_00407 [Deltaproteobacteria bacterium ADurb.Bin207]HNS99328.1 tetratricopeptide repeat protein [Polyangiaceae bacterium]HNZ20964.1 tetratricopeptide repeat protein [Polyangiaceae bacterium]HOD24007.1 tetratricopeptide repeat protein [Polyangiaceae bacterium]HOE48874.1 tetratricopeptide repeat protein [Polyangiaceae bacterium]